MTVLDKGRDAKGRDRVKKLPKGRDVMSVTTFKSRDNDTMRCRGGTGGCVQSSGFLFWVLQCHTRIVNFSWFFADSCFFVFLCDFS